MQSSTSDERLAAGLLYFLNFFTAIIGPFLIWYVKRDSPFVNQHGLHYLNFLVSYFLYQAAAGFFYFIAIGFIINVILSILMAVFITVAGIYAFKGKQFRIPLVIRFFS
ncbi:DUF4870 domain-containing protein [Jeotgalibacillus campisalis]|uniref:DUF4870 domain-containing protein n=1 Tax=Jeotgalibacillus campisalis TaxID=220754 RepID=UPI000596D63C|nr:DUF4870 domain-containing protein [Jeotgalibacillus campisalis]